MIGRECAGVDSEDRQYLGVLDLDLPVLDVPVVPIDPVEGESVRRIVTSFGTIRNLQIRGSNGVFGVGAVEGDALMWIMVFSYDTNLSDIEMVRDLDRCDGVDGEDSDMLERPDIDWDRDRFETLPFSERDA